MTKLFTLVGVLLGISCGAMADEPVVITLTPHGDSAKPASQPQPEQPPQEEQTTVVVQQTSTTETTVSVPDTNGHSFSYGGASIFGGGSNHTGETKYEGGVSIGGGSSSVQVNTQTAYSGSDHVAVDLGVGAGIGARGQFTHTVLFGAGVANKAVIGVGIQPFDTYLGLSTGTKSRQSFIEWNPMGTAAVALTGDTCAALIGAKAGFSSGTLGESGWFRPAVGGQAKLICSGAMFDANYVRVFTNSKPVDLLSASAAVGAVGPSSGLVGVRLEMIEEGKDKNVPGSWATREIRGLATFGGTISR